MPGLQQLVAVNELYNEPVRFSFKVTGLYVMTTCLFCCHGMCQFKARQTATATKALCLGKLDKSLLGEVHIIWQVSIAN